MAIETLLARLASDPHLPTPPALALQLLEKASQPECSLSEVGTLIARDPALCARLLKATLENIRVHEERNEAERQRRTGAEALERLGRRHELILEAVGEGIYGLDREGCITFVNAAAARMAGWDAALLVGRSSHDYWHARCADGTAYPWAQSPARLILSDGRTRVVENEIF
jgi:PAS domain-containing protein